MKFICTLLTMFLLSYQAGAQGVPAWTKMLGGSSYDAATKIRQTSDSGFIVLGLTSSVDGDVAGSNHGADDLWIIKLDAAGNTQWQKTYGGSGWEEAWFILETADSGYIVSGQTSSTDGDIAGLTHHGGIDCWVLKLDPNGNIQWQQVYGGTDHDWGVSIDTTTDGGYILLGSAHSADGDLAGVARNTGSDFWLLKLDPSGNIQWQKCYGGSNTEFGRCVRQTGDGGYILAGETYSWDGHVAGGGYHPSPVGSSDFWIVKVNAAGDLIWQHCFGGKYAEVPFEVRQTSDNGYIVAGNSESPDGDVQSGVHGSYDSWVVKLNNAGSILWEKAIGGSENDRFREVQETTDGGYIFAGSTWSTDGDLATAGSHGRMEYWIAKLDASGMIQWHQLLGGSAHDEGRSVQQTADGCFVMAGVSDSDDGQATGNHGGNDIWVIKWCDIPSVNFLPVGLSGFSARYLNNTVQLQWKFPHEPKKDRFEIQRSTNGMDFITIAVVKESETSFASANYNYTDTTIHDQNADFVYYRLRLIDIDGKSDLSAVAGVKLQRIHSRGGGARLWPNPGNGIFHVQLGDHPVGAVTVTVYNSVGQLVKQRLAHTQQFDIDLGRNNKGTYHIRIDKGNGSVQYRSIVLQ